MSDDSHCPVTLYRHTDFKAANRQLDWAGLGKSPVR